MELPKIVLDQAVVQECSSYWCSKEKWILRWSRY